MRGKTWKLGALVALVVAAGAGAEVTGVPTSIFAWVQTARVQAFTAGAVDLRGNRAAAATTCGVRVYNNAALGATGGLICAYSDNAFATETWRVEPGGKLRTQTTDSSGTPGAATINKPTGKVAVAAAAASVVVTNNMVTAASLVFHDVQTTDATCTFVKSVIPGAGSFTVTMNANCTGATTVGWKVEN